MSYILDALKKSDKQREQDQVPDLNTVQVEQSPEKARKASWYVPVAMIVFLNVLFVLFLFWRHDKLASIPQEVAPDMASSQQGDQNNSPDSTASSQSPSIAIDQITAVDNHRSTAGPAASQQASPSETTIVLADHGEKASAEPIVDLMEPEQSPESSSLESQMVFEENAEQMGGDVAVASVSRKEIPEQAIVDVPVESSPSDSSASLVEKALHIYQLPQGVQQELPEIHIDAHMFYKDRPASRFASINGKVLREGHFLVPNLKVAEISSDGVVFSYSTYLFYVPVF